MYWFFSGISDCSLLGAVPVVFLCSLFELFNNALLFNRIGRTSNREKDLGRVFWPVRAGRNQR
nr:hypothetical protein [Escherichia coli]